MNKCSQNINKNILSQSRLHFHVRFSESTIKKKMFYQSGKVWLHSQNQRETLPQLPRNQMCWLAGNVNVSFHNVQYNVSLFIYCTILPQSCIATMHMKLDSKLANTVTRFHCCFVLSLTGVVCRNRGTQD